MVAMVNQTKALMSNVETKANSTECSIANNQQMADIPQIRHQMIKGHLNWDVAIQNLIVSASFLGNMISQIPGGRMSEIFGAKEAVVWTTVIASTCNILSPVAADLSPYAILLLQFIKGLGLGGQQPAISLLITRWFTTLEKGFLVSVMYSGLPAGAFIVGIACGAMCDGTFLGGWPATFYVFGTLGLPLAIGYQYLTSNFPEEDSNITDAELKYILDNRADANLSKDLKVPWIPMLTAPSTWAAFFGMLGQDWVSFYFASVHPMYLVTVLHFTNTESGYLNSFPFLGQMTLTFLFSYSSMVLVKKGFATTNTVRKTCNSVGCILFTIGLIGVIFSGCDREKNTIFFVFAMITAGLGYVGSCCVTMDMTINFTGTLFGIISTLASVSGFIIPVIVGSVTKQQTLSEWAIVFYITIGVCLSSGLFFQLFGSAKLQDWDKITNEKSKEDINKSRRNTIPELWYIVVEKL